MFRIMPTDSLRNRSCDFSALKRPIRNTKDNHVVNDIKNIAASQLFDYADKQNERQLRRSSSQPEMELSYGRRSSFSRCPRRAYSPHERYFKNSYWNKKSNYESDTTLSEDDDSSSNFETMYEVIQRKLQRHLKRQEIFSNEGIQNACKELRKQALVAELADGWQSSLSDLEIASGMKMEVLQAIYMLRNAHRGDLFSSQESVENHRDRLRKQTPPDDITDGRMVAATTPLTPISSDETMLPKISRPTSLAFTRNSESLVSSGEGTPTNLSSPSSGGSTPSFRKKPKRPEIKISEHNKQYKDYIEILRAESLQSLHDQNYDVNGIEISEEVIAKAFLSSHMKSDLNSYSPDSPANLSRNSLDKLKVQSLCKERPESPISLFMKPILDSGKTDDILSEIYEKLTPVFTKLKTYEDQANQLSTLQVKIAILQEEKRQLAGLLKDKREESVKRKRDVGVQKHLEIVTEISHVSCQTNLLPAKRSIKVGKNHPAELSTIEKGVQNQVFMSDNCCQSNSIITKESSTETICRQVKDSGVDPLPRAFYTSTKSCQETPQQNTSHTQTTLIEKHHASIMVGASTHTLIDKAVGNRKVLSEVGLQVFLENPKLNISTQCNPIPMSSVETQVDVPKRIDFACGENIADKKMVDKGTISSINLTDASVNTQHILKIESSVQCYQPIFTSVAIGDGNVFDIVCDRCGNLETVNIGVGYQATSESPTCIDDKLCDCIKPVVAETAVGNHTIFDNFCDKCDSLQTQSLGVGDDTVSDLLCDKCTNLQQCDVCVGGDYDIHNIICDICDNKPTTTSVAIGNGDVTETNCENCKNKNSRDSSYFNFDFNITAMQDKSHVQQQPIICHYCGNKVDLNDDTLDETLQAMRDSMQNLASNQGSLKRSDARKHLNLDFVEDDRLNTGMYSSKDSVLVTPNSDENYNANVQSDEEDDDDSSSSSHDDVVQACKMLHNHFSGEKPLKQQQMMKYMATIQALWFKTVKKRRVNASVVKSYIDLFQQRIPELLETIINLSDDEGNTALHFAMTYKNLGVASILMDSGECCADLVNQAGYSPLMLGALVGFERKNDKYIMQRLVRMGNINKEASDTGQTPLMLAVSRGNTNMVELLLDAGCDINAVDDEGSTALMCACEHGNANVVKMLLANPDCDATVEDNEGSTALSIAMDSRRKDLALLIYGSLNFDARGRIKLSPSKQSLLGLGRRSPSPVIGRR